MASWAPNIYVLQYLKSTNQLTDQLEEKAKGYMRVGEYMIYTKANYLTIENVHIINLALKGLTLSQTIPGFYVSAVQVFGKHRGKRRNCS